MSMPEPSSGRRRPSDSTALNGPPSPWRLRLAGHELAVTPVHAPPDGSDTTVAVAVDGRVVTTRRATWTGPDLPLSELAAAWDLAELELAGAALQVRAGLGGLRSCRVVVPPRADGRPGKPERLDLEPPPGSRARRRWDFSHRHPRWYAVRHVVAAATQVGLGLVALSLAVGWMPWGWLPDLDLPSLPPPDLPRLPLPSIPMPDVTVPDWVRAVGESKKYWLPILLAVFVARGELKRRRHRDEQAARDSG